MKGLINSLISFLLVTNLSCNSITAPEKPQGKKIEIILKDNKYVLLKNGNPFYIKGASGTTNLKLLKQIGGNTFRTYTTENAQELLDEAHQLGLSVILGIWIEPYSKEKHIDDTLFNERTLRFISREVQKYKNHPALLAWALGNEVHPIEPNFSSWKLLNEACKLTKKIDANHPVTTCLAGYPRRNMPIIKSILKNVDFVAFNTFGGIKTFEKKLNNLIWGYDGPYIFSEWGANGYWEMLDKTTWESPIEIPHSQTANKLTLVWKNYVTYDKKNCLGSFIFYWGQKQEFTSTWYSLFSKENEKTPIVDSLAKLWGGYVNNYSPNIKEINWVNYKTNNIRVKPNSTHQIKIKSTDFENDSLSYSFEIRHETFANIDDFGIEAEPLKIERNIEIKKEKIIFNVPNSPGLYRAFIKVSDHKGGCDLANFTFMVEN